MQPREIFGISVLLGTLVWALIAAQYLWPALRGQPRSEALRPLLLLHAFRFVGLAFLVPGVVSPDLPDAFARPAAYGDLATSLLALVAIATLRSPVGTIIVWVFNTVGTVDLLNAFNQYPNTASNQIGDLDAVITSLRLQQVTLVAHDASGPPAIDWALDHPERVAGLVLLNT